MDPIFVLRGDNLLKQRSPAIQILAQVSSIPSELYVIPYERMSRISLT